MLRSCLSFVKKESIASSAIRHRFQFSTFALDNEIASIVPEFQFRELPDETLYILDGTSMIYNAYFSRESTDDFLDTKTIINDQEINKIELFLKFLSELNKSSRVGLIVSKNIEQALHPKNSIKLHKTSFSINNETLYSSTRKYNLDKETFSIIFNKTIN